MFEKEAEEYAKQNNPAEYGVRATHFTVLNSFKDGAEFGYKKTAVQSDVYTSGFNDGLKAALDIKDISDKKLEPILYKLKDLGIIESWYYNGTYHVKGGKRMTEDKKHQLDKLAASDMINYLSARVFDMEEYIHIQNKQLTRAKELFNDFLVIAKVEHLKGRYETVDEAEQFLKEVEE